MAPAGRTLDHRGGPANCEIRNRELRRAGGARADPQCRSSTASLHPRTAKGKHERHFSVRDDHGRDKVQPLSRSARSLFAVFAKVSGRAVVNLICSMAKADDTLAMSMREIRRL